MADEYTQDDRRVRIDTVLNKLESGDPLLLTKVHGVEGISRPFTYEVTMLRQKSKPPIAPSGLINTMVKISIKIAEREITRLPVIRSVVHDQEDAVSYVARYGVFETFRDEGVVEDDFRQYSGTIVPVLKMMDRQVAFRVFERLNVLHVINSVALNFPGLTINQKLLEDETFPEMEYCVQFQETSYNFISRLLAKFGIWYYFDHEATPWVNTMVLGSSNMNFNRCAISEGQMKGVALDEMYLAPSGAKPSALTISSFKRLYVPAPRWQSAGDFNILDPTDRILGDAAIDRGHDLISPVNSKTKGNGSSPTKDDLYRVETFPVAAATNSQAKQAANDSQAAAESQVVSITGDTRNITFAVGRLFGMKAAATEIPAEAGNPDVILSDGSLQAYEKSPNLDLNYLLVYLDFVAVEGSYTTKGFWGTLFGDVVDLFDPNSPTGGVDALVSFTSAGLNNYLQNELPYLIQGQWDPQNKPGQVDFMPFFLGGGVGAITALLPAVRKAFAGLFMPPPSDFSVSFQAIPWNSKTIPNPRLLLLPTGAKPIAHGPHSAVVVGPAGAAPKGQDFCADVLGRVRVRFPWDPGPLQPPNPPEMHRDPYASADNTCWVRSSHAWAGRCYGAQFLPRIGEEVLVAFIDGDPDRPIIIGRAYNADHGATNLPFPNSLGAYKQNLTPDSLLNAKAQDHFPRSGIKTRSTPSTDASGAATANGFHLIRFDDTGGKEQLLFRSQNRLDITALGSRFESIGGDRHLTVGGIDHQHQVVGGNYVSKVFQDYTLHIGDPSGPYNGGHRYERVEQEYELNVVKDMLISLEQSLSAEVGEIASLSAGSIVLQATNKLTLKVGNSWIVITPAGVFASGPLIGDNSGGSPDTASTVNLTMPIDNSSPADSGNT